MAKISKKAVFGIGAGLLAAAVGAVCLLKKKKQDDDVCAEDECFDEEVEEVED